MDAEDRENEGDLCIPAEFVTPTDIVFFLKNSTGLLCVACNPLRVEELELDPMICKNTDPNRTPFTVSVDLDPSFGITTGVSADDKSKTIRALADPKFKASAFTRPGHIFPLRANPQGLYGRQGHTEASVELCKLSNVYPACLISELMIMEGPNTGQMMRLAECQQFGQKYNIPIVTIEDIRNALPAPTSSLPVEIGSKVHPFQIKVYTDVSGCQYVVLSKGQLSGANNVWLRVHSECLTGDVFSSLRCDCRSQLTKAFEMLAEQESGLLIYIRGHEGRGIGLSNKIQCYALQDTGNHNTFTANHQIYLPSDCRSYNYLPTILKDLGIVSVVLYTNNSSKITAIQDYITNVVNFVGKETSYNQKYLQDKIAPVLKQKRKIGLVYTTGWHTQYVQKMVSDCHEFFESSHLRGSALSDSESVELIECPVAGAYELISGCRRLIKKGITVIIAIGILMKGETDHYHYIADAVSHGLMQLQIQHDVDIINGLLTVSTEEHIKNRVSGTKKATPDWCKIALERCFDS